MFICIIAKKKSNSHTCKFCYLRMCCRPRKEKTGNGRGRPRKKDVIVKEEKQEKEETEVRVKNLKTFFQKFCMV